MSTGHVDVDLDKLDALCDQVKFSLSNMDPDVAVPVVPLHDLISEVRAARKVIAVARRAANPVNRHIPVIGRLRAALLEFDKATQ